MTETKPEPSKARSWWKFSLRTLFIIVTLVCCVLAYQIYIVRQRQATLRQIKRSWSYSVLTAAQYQASGFPGKLATVNPLRRLLGDEAIQSIGYYPHMSNDPEVRRIARMFPEATVHQNDPPLEPCHPGCFPHGTLISTPSGMVRIEAIHEGDSVYSVNSTGEKKSLVVKSIFRTHNRLWNVATAAGLLRTTETQPLCVSLTAHQPAGELQPGDLIMIWREDENPEQVAAEREVQATTVIRVEKTDEIVPVINLVLGNKEPFIANGFLARSKPPKDDSPNLATHQHEHP